MLTRMERECSFPSWGMLSGRSVAGPRYEGRQYVSLPVQSTTPPSANSKISFDTEGRPRVFSSLS
jgi:hypothetical protein